MKVPIENQGSVSERNRKSGIYDAGIQCIFGQRHDKISIITARARPTQHTAGTLRSKERKSNVQGSSTRNSAERVPETKFHNISGRLAGERSGRGNIDCGAPQT